MFHLPPGGILPSSWSEAEARCNAKAKERILERSGNFAVQNA